MRKKNPSHKVPCYRDHCCGASNQRQNFLSVTSRGQTRSHSKKKVKRVKKSANKKEKDAIKNILQQSYQQMRDENQQLLKKLASKKKKIEQLKSKIKEYEQEIRRLKDQQKLGELGRKTSNQSNGSKKYTKVIQDSQTVAKQSLQSLKKLEDQYHQYRESAERKIDKLRSEKQKLMSDTAQNLYSKQIEDLKHQLTRFKQDQINVNSMKNLHHPGTSEEKLKLQIATLKATIGSLRSENDRLKNYTRELQDQLEQRTTMSQNKERELKNNLDAINQKISIWQRQHRQTKDDAMNWERQYNILFDKYQRKKHKHRANNAEWAEIFKQFIQEIDKLKQQLDIVSQRNAKLIKLYGNQ